MTTALIYALGVIVFVIGVVVSIALHEVGHMYPARKFGVKVTQFFVGFGKTIWSVRRGETEYGFKAVPLGGFVKLVGMLPPARDEDPHVVRSTSTGLVSQLANDARQAEYELVTDADLDRLFYKLPPWKKVIVMSGGPMVNVVLAVLFFSIAFMGFGAYVPTTTVEAVSDCAISDAEQGRTCTDDDPVTPARLAGLEQGDTITSFNGEAIGSWDQLTTVIRANGDRAAEITWLRDGTEMSTEVRTSVLARASLDDPDRVEDVGFLGVLPRFDKQRQGPVFVAQRLGDVTTGTVEAIFYLPSRMVDVVKAALGAERDPNGPISVVGASRVAGELVTVDDPTWSERAQRLLVLLASLNMFLALFNFIPLLPLDGGHIAGAVWESWRRRWARLRRKPDPGYVDVAMMLPVAYGVAFILMIMSVVLIYVDIVNPVSIQ